MPGDSEFKGGDAVGGGISVGIGDSSSADPRRHFFPHHHRQYDRQQPRPGRQGRLRAGAKGGDGLGGGIWFGGQPTSPPPQNSIDNSVITGNFALGGKGAGNMTTDGQGVVGGVYITPGAVVFFSPKTRVTGNHASTNHDNIGP